MRFMQARLVATVGVAIVIILLVGVALAFGLSNQKTLCTENGVGTIGLTVLNASDKPITGLPVQIKSTECKIANNSAKYLLGIPLVKFPRDSSKVMILIGRP
jgi:hypothetical protein